ncbi:phosphofructokinase [Ammonifex degensii KC4]|uniref:ATP-dependent 6-phosphofructokinase n=1 Tax=Ammonifex degensii (strain DSM 10501 / KC4) TaxID=429009 RepID=C9R7R6_AMMDK|nr:6-phosphofructokinase [Ammonifex degensii]ACX52345.1 phosphofructokinase [Ammonifex degensii KC4]
MARAKVSIKRIGILTGGGDAPGLNAVIRAAVKVAVRNYGLSVIGFEDGFAGLVENRSRRLTLKDVVGILPRGGTILGTTNRENPFHYPVRENGEIVYKDLSQQAIDNLNSLGVQALIIIGGDGSLKIAKEIWERYNFPVIGVPKTIDNDIAATDQTFGFDTAVATATEAIDKLHTTAEAHHRVMVLEVMGRYTGWIALHAGVAGGADVILIPEIPFTIDKVCEKILERQREGKKFSIVVVAEGAKPVGGEVVVKKIVKESFESIRLGGIGNVVGEQIERITGIETRVTVLGHLQRGGSPTPFDRLLATRFGAAAVNFLMEGRFGEMVSLRTPDITSVPLAEAVGTMRRVPLGCDLIRAARQMGISFGD